MRISTKMPLIFVVLITAELVATFASVTIVQDQITSTVGFYSIQATKTTLAGIYQTIDEKTIQLSLLINNDDVMEFVKKSNSNFDKMEGRDDYISRVDSDWKEKKEMPLISDILSNDLSHRLLAYQAQIDKQHGHRVFSEIFVTNKYGVVVGSTDRTSDYFQPDEEWYQQTVASKDLYWLGQPEYDESSKAYSVDTVMRIEDGDGNLVGVVKGVMNLDYVKDNLSKLQQNIPYKNVPYLVDRNGYSILSVDTGNIPSFQSDTELKEFGTNLSDLEPLKFAHANESGYLIWSDGSASKFTTYAAMPPTGYPEKLGWILLLDFDKNEVFEPIKDLQNMILVIGLTIAAISAIICYYFARTISNPLKSLYTAAVSIGKGNFEQQVTVRSKDELGILCESFNLMINDIKRKIELERELARTQEQSKGEKLRTVGELSSRIVHDLRNPLTLIRNCCEMLSQLRREGDDKSKNYIALIQKSVDRMSDQLDDVLDYVRTSPLHKKPESCLDTIQFAVEASDIPENIMLTIPKNDLQVPFDAGKIEVVFTNLLRNSIQAIGENDGTIDIGLSQRDGFAAIEFTDSGPGISAADLPRIFEPLFTTRKEGTGLGLPSCKSIVDQHGGKIEVKLNPTKFRVYLPLQ